jgi:hypothetical protein
MTGADEINEILLASEAVIEFIEISTPVAMISSITIIDDW